MKNYVEMTDAELDRAVLLVMGYTQLSTVTWICDGRSINADKFKPSTDHNHAAEFSAWFRLKGREAGRDARITVSLTTPASDEIFRVGVLLSSGPCFYATSKSRSRAETIATLLAFDAMAGK